jgi:hypothetical protein
MTSAARRLTVRFEEAVWQEAIRGFSREPLQIAMSARRIAERHGIALADVHPCEAIGPDGTQLVGCAKLYLPLGDGPPSERPMAFVLRLARAQDGMVAWILSLSVIAIQDRAYAASTSEHTASCMVDFLIAAALGS